MPNMLEHIDKYIEYISTQKGLSSNSILSYKNDLLKFHEYLKSENLEFEKLKRSDVRGFLAELNHIKMKKTSINRIISSLKGFVKYKKRFGYSDPACILEIESLKKSQYLPVFLFDEEFEKLIDFECKVKEDFRDRAVFELIFCTGLRVSELTSIDINDIDISNEIRVSGKGDKERVVLFGNRCRNYLDQYINERKEFKPRDNALFLNHLGGRLTDRGV